MKPIVISSGEPAGIGPELLIKIACHQGLAAVVCADRELILERARLVKETIAIEEYQAGVTPSSKPGVMTVLHTPLLEKAKAGQLNPANAAYVLAVLDKATQGCLNGEFSALVTAPVHKAIINQAGIDFSGHTEYLAKLCNVEQVVMMLACPEMRVALVTTHLPLSQVPKAITFDKITAVVEIVARELTEKFAITKPRLMLSGLNPHAGENGILGREEIDVITPAIKQLQIQGIDITGPMPADTMFNQDYLDQCDCFIAMYHDQGLSVLKYAAFGNAVNITLGLPIIRTSVDHGTALDLAGTGKASEQSLLAAINTAKSMC